jgi:predicted site-specific integrase-resolvase
MTMNIGTVKTAAIWARISGPDQQSLPSQVAEVKEWLQAQGFIVPMERIIMVDWTSKDILRCPEMQKLLSWVANREVEAVGSLHLDRFAARPGQMSQIFDTFKDAEVQLLLKQTLFRADGRASGWSSPWQGTFVNADQGEKRAA